MIRNCPIWFSLRAPTWRIRISWAEPPCRVNFKYFIMIKFLEVDDLNLSKSQLLGQVWCRSGDVWGCLGTRPRKVLLFSIVFSFTHFHFSDQTLLLQALIMDVCMGFIHIPAGIWLNIGLDPFWHTCVVAGKSYRAVHALLLDQWHRSLSEIQEPFSHTRCAHLRNCIGSQVLSFW